MTTLNKTESNVPAVQSSTTALPFLLVIKRTGSIAGGMSQLLYDSQTKQSISIVNGTKVFRNISDSDEAIARRILNDSGFFDSNSFYPPTSGTTDYFEYTVIARLNDKLNAVYWTDASAAISDRIKNLPFILDHVLGTGNVF